MQQYDNYELIFSPTRLGKALEESGLTREAFAEKVGVEVMTVYRWLNKSSLPSRANQSRIMEVLGEGPFERFVKIYNWVDNVRNLSFNINILKYSAKNKTGIRAITAMIGTLGGIRVTTQELNEMMTRQYNCPPKYESRCSQCAHSAPCNKQRLVANIVSNLALMRLDWVYSELEEAIISPSPRFTIRILSWRDRYAIRQLLYPCSLIRCFIRLPRTTLYYTALHNLVNNQSELMTLLGSEEPEVNPLMVLIRKENSHEKISLESPKI